MGSTIRLFCWLICCASLTSSFEKNDYPKQHKTVIQKNPILFECRIQNITGCWWNFEGKLLYVEDNAVSNKLLANSELLDNYSLFIESTFLFHEGVFECINNTGIVSWYFLEVMVVSQRKEVMRILRFFTCSLVLCAPFLCYVKTLFCESPQYIELWKAGIINCVVDENYFGMYWYNSSESRKNTPLLSLEGSTFGGAVYPSNEFHLLENGSLSIIEVTLQHEHIFRVVLVVNKELGLIEKKDVQVVVILNLRKIFLE
ncbi:hypothetical protein HOLleu_03488 [Holothuria leucospilota]|uniref:Uncharacterized protein n=1 Tax=Holothuria leucospilota TaxID=206669 RepID=A0A9Q1CSN0_HOLLE|nr:hypothetical protein HOLleu_03488 [Holothuria leucospilota]